MDVILKDYVAPLKLENYLDLIYQQTGQLFVAVHVEDLTGNSDAKFFRFLEMVDKSDLNLSGLEKQFIPNEIEDLRPYDESEDDPMEGTEKSSIIGFLADNFDLNIVTPKNSGLAQNFVVGGNGNYTVLNEFGFETFMGLFEPNNKKILVYTFGRYYLYLFTSEKQIALWDRSYDIGVKYRIKNNDILDKEGNDNGWVKDKYNFTLESDDIYNFALYGITVKELFGLDISIFKKIPLYSLFIFENPQIKEVIDDVVEIKKVVDKPIVSLRNAFGNSIILLLEEETPWSELIKILNSYLDLSGLYQEDYEMIESGKKRRR